MMRGSSCDPQSQRSSGERGSQGANFTAGVREREDANRTREAGDSVLVKTEGAKR
jgi:hypothetical protein